MSDNTTDATHANNAAQTDHIVRNNRTAYDDFSCPHCGLNLPGTAPDGGGRTHCPNCLHARHVDAARCGRSMTPISIAVASGGDWTLIHRCAGCRELVASRVRDDDNQLLLMRTAVRPLAQPPFPLDAFGDL